jgi:hypothetical protein
MRGAWLIVSAVALGCSAGLPAAAGGHPAGVVAAGRVATACPPLPRQVPIRLITRPRWLSRTLVTEYFPIREAWFRGRRVLAPGLTSEHRVDWLYGAYGVAMPGRTRVPLRRPLRLELGQRRRCSDAAVLERSLDSG